MAKVYRFIGKRGRITVPFSIRQCMKLKANDLISFYQEDDETVVIRKEKVCDNCCDVYEDETEMTLQELLDSFSEEEQRMALIQLSVKWAEKVGANT